MIRRRILFIFIENLGDFYPPIGFYFPRGKRKKKNDIARNSRKTTFMSTGRDILQTSALRILRKFWLKRINKRFLLEILLNVSIVPRAKLVQHLAEPTPDYSRFRKENIYIKKWIQYCDHNFFNTCSYSYEYKTHCIHINIHVFDTCYSNKI